MSVRPYLSLLVAVLCWMGTATATAAEPKSDVPPITESIRRRLDAYADQLPNDGLREIVSDVSQDTSHWLAASRALSPDEEFRRSTAAHRHWLASVSTVKTPQTADRVLERLVAHLPPRMKPAAIRFSLTVFKETDRAPGASFTTGGGYLYLSESWLQALLADERAGPHRLAFVLAHQLGHICRQHCRRRYQWLSLQDELLTQKEVDEPDKRQFIRKAIQAGLRGYRKNRNFQYSRAERRRADLFAVHLCRNAGIDVEAGLDALRLEAIQADPTILKLCLNGGGNHETDAIPEACLPSLRRLKHLRGELDGRITHSLYGLFEANFNEGITWVRAQPQRQRPPAIVFVHGMESRLRRFHPLIDLLRRRSAGEYRIFGFRYPNDHSLAAVGKYLKCEMDRVFPSSGEVNFVCHSAGGLVFRAYAEIEQGDFRRAVFLGTPHHGSNLAQLRPLLEMKQFLGDLKLNYPAALENVVHDGAGQIGYDLQPDSLFLRFLDQNAIQSHRSRYHIICGRAVQRNHALLLKGSLVVAQAALERKFAGQDDAGRWRRSARQWVKRLRLPREITEGDLAVALESAQLDGAASTDIFPVHHLELMDNPEIMRSVARILFDTHPVNGEGGT